MIELIKQLFCKHEPSLFRVLSDVCNDKTVMCRKRYKMYTLKNANRALRHPMNDIIGSTVFYLAMTALFGTLGFIMCDVIFGPF